jgi:hypothetical protein
MTTFFHETRTHYRIVVRDFSSGRRPRNERKLRKRRRPIDRQFWRVASTWTYQRLANHSEAQKRSRQREKFKSTVWLSAPEIPTLLFCDEDTPCMPSIRVLHTEPHGSVCSGRLRCLVRRALGRHPTRRSGAARACRRFDHGPCRKVVEELKQKEEVDGRKKKQ